MNLQRLFGFWLLGRSRADRRAGRAGTSGSRRRVAVTVGRPGFIRTGRFGATAGLNQLALTSFT
jgi:hypothetical protein